MLNHPSGDRCDSAAEPAATSGKPQPLLLRSLASVRDGPVLLRRPRSLRVDPLLLRCPDVVALVTIFLALQFLIPARLVVGGLGAAGRPTVAMALGLGLLWAGGVLYRGTWTPGRQPVRWLVGAFTLVQLMSYAAGLDRGLPDIEESGAVRWLIVTVALGALAVAIADGTPSLDRLNVLLGSLVGFTGVMAAVGAAQFLIGFDATRYVHIPGMRFNSTLIGIAARGDEDYARVAGTASHYIEFGVVLAMVLPLAVHRAMHPEPGTRRLGRWLLAALVGCGIPFSISRSSTVGLGVALLVMAVVWPWRFRAQALCVGIVALLAFRVVQPGVLGTIRALFTNTENDPSVQDRISDYAYVSRMFPERPWLGRGAGTFLPDRYILLDNQFLGALMSTGVLGVIAFAALFVGGYAMARSVRLRSPSPERRHLAQCLGASLIAGFVCSGTFDSFSFSTFSGVTFILLGIVGALWRLERRDGWRLPLQISAGAPYVASPWMADDARRRKLAHREKRPPWSRQEEAQ